jgi:hypothetical protein
MENASSNASDEKKWEHAHVCSKCGHILGPDLIELNSIVLGVITCPKCEWSGPINLQIIEKKNLGE